MQKYISDNGMLLLSLFLQITGLSFAVLIDPYIKKKHKSVMQIIAAFVLSLIAQNCIDFFLYSSGGPVFARTITSIYGYSVRPLILVLFLYIIGRDRSYPVAWILIGINTLIHTTALFSGVCFRISSENHFVRGPLGYTCHFISALLLVYLVILSIREYVRVRKWEAMLPVSNIVLIFAAVGLDTFTNIPNNPVSFLTVAVVSCCVFYYIWLHLQFVREHEQALRAEQRIQIMMSQIQPHFLYNTLTTIQALCKTDPEKAFETTEKFGAYLRQNIDSLQMPNLIPIGKELDHVRIYADIEQIRFPSVRVEYDAQDLDFLIPALTIQPLVENSIRHGVRIREQGIVTVRTRKRGDGHEIVVSDNGVGFDVDAESQEERSHIGLKNVRERVEQMCHGSMTVDSRPGDGTTVTIIIP